MNAFKDAGALTGDEVLQACRNVGIEVTCGGCMATFYTGMGATHTCTEKRQPWIPIANYDPNFHGKRLIFKLDSGRCESGYARQEEGHYEFYNHYSDRFIPGRNSDITHFIPMPE